MIYVGLTGWGDHDFLYEGVQDHEKLQTYASYFPVVELDSTFYAVLSEKTMEKWARETPDNFRFIVKAYKAMTVHERGYSPFTSREEMFKAYHQSLKPLVETNKLACILCQFPPWFDCKREHVQWLRYLKRQLEPHPVALEFRHQSWFFPPYKNKTLQFIREEGWIHTICDEPQAGVGSIPIVLEATEEKTVIRMHGRNVHGWNDPGNGQWREVRYLYKYNEEELKEWAQYIRILEQKTKQLYVIFNNNSGKDAAKNALQFIDLLQLQYDGLAPRQLHLF